METSLFEIVPDAPGVTLPQGFRAAGAGCDVRGKGTTERLDLALIHSPTSCTVAGVYTQNRIVAAPVKLCQAVQAAGGPIHAIVANSGNANACTGPQGKIDAEAMAAQVETTLGLPPGSTFVASTGRIGRVLPMDRITSGIAAAAAALGEAAKKGEDAADAILTSDTRRKTVGVRVPTPQGVITLGGIAKGAGMIEPHMATMLAFLTTDAAIPTEILQPLLKRAVDRSFNAITVDGDMSTNDTVLLLANGASGITLDTATLPAFEAALHYACERLARMIVGDGEKITKVVELRVTGATTDAEADRVARTIGNSLLVKSSWFGGDPNWGRILDAAGYSGAPLVEETLSLAYRASDADAPVPAFVGGLGVDQNLAAWREIVARKHFIIELDLALGGGSARLWASDLTEGYVNFNKSE